MKLSKTQRTKLQTAIESGPVTTVREAVILIVMAVAYRIFHGRRGPGRRFSFTVIKPQLRRAGACACSLCATAFDNAGTLIESTRG
jgi:hypothetical protein